MSERERVYQIRLALMEQLSNLSQFNRELIEQGRSIDNPIYWLDKAINALRLHEGRLSGKGEADA